MAATVTQISDVRTEDTYPFANTRAARMFAEGLAKLEKEHGISQRTLAKQLSYKSSVVISHMASGRAPIPIERTADFSRLLKLDAQEFLMAALDQRYPQLNVTRVLSGMQSAASTHKGSIDEELLMLEDLQSAAGVALADLPGDQFSILREVAADRQAGRRWVSVPELGVLDLFRSERPDILKNGLKPQQRTALKECVAAL
jgi:hypothetical protein